MNHITIRGAILSSEIDTEKYSRNMRVREITKLVLRHEKYKDTDCNLEGFICHLESETRELRRAVESGNIDDALYETADLSNCVDKINTILELVRTDGKGES